MATYTWVDLKIPEATLLADLNGILWDLQRAREFAKMLIAEFDAPTPNWQLVEPLSIAITVTYSRAFSEGVRHHLQEADLETFSESQRNSHNFIRAYRDKHVAHSVNEFEENIARANYCTERVNDEGIISIGCGGGRVTSLSRADAQAVIDLATVLETHVQSRIKREQERLLIIVRSMPVGTVLDGGQKAFVTSNAKVAERRKP